MELSIDRAASAAAVVIAIGFAVIGIALNIYEPSSFSGITDDPAARGVISIIIGALALVVPVFASRLWVDRRHFASLIAWGIWALAFGLIIFAGTNFAAGPTYPHDLAVGSARVSDLLFSRFGLQVSTHQLENATLFGFVALPACSGILLAGALQPRSRS
jgi:hypothetical protein